MQVGGANGTACCVGEHEVRVLPPITGFLFAIGVLLTATVVGAKLTAVYRIAIAASLVALGGLGALSGVRHPSPVRRLLAALATAGIGAALIAIEQAVG